MVCLSLTIMYVFCLKQCWTMWDCVKLEDGKYALESDPSITCFQGGPWSGFAAMAFLLLIVFSMFPVYLIATIDGKNQAT